MEKGRRDFIKTSALALAGSTAAVQFIQAGNGMQCVPAIIQNKKNMKLSFRPYNLQLKHVFTVASYSRTTTPGVQVEVTYEGVTGYGEASMPPYLGESVESVVAFLSKVNLSQFADPFQLEDILLYVDGLAPGNTAAKASVDIALHDLVGKLLGAPWYKIWGLNRDKTPSTTFTIGIDTEEVVKEKTREVAGQFNILKVNGKSVFSTKS